MQGINEIMFVFYYQAHGSTEWLVTQPFTMGEILDGHIEFEFNNEETLPIDDIDWANDKLKMAIVPNRSNK